MYAKDGLLGKTASWTKDEYASRASLFGTESAVACVADQPPGAASLDWFQHAGYKVHGPNFDARETLFAEFNGIYSAVRFYDGTRVEDPALFSVTGILPSDIEELDKRALKMFGEILLSSEPPGKLEDGLLLRGGGSYYSFTRLTYEYGYGSDIKYSGTDFSAVYYNITSFMLY